MMEDWIYGSNALKTTFIYTVAKIAIESKYIPAIHQIL